MFRSRPAPLHVDIDLSSSRRVFVCGDVHSHLALLIDQMKRHDYDADGGDRLFCLGDWLDRGSDVLVIRDFLAANPTVRWTRGNHEEILHFSVNTPGRRAREAAQGFHIRNGGAWLYDFLTEVGDEDVVSEELVAFSDVLNAAPVAYRVRTPGGRIVGLVHANVPTRTWDEMAHALNGREPGRTAMAKDCMWGRDRADLILDGIAARERLDLTVPDVDQVFLGHTITGSAPVRYGNISLIDTGAYGSGVLTMVDVDAWIAGD